MKKNNNIDLNISYSANWDRGNMIIVLLILLAFLFLLKVDPLITQRFLKLLFYLLN